MSSVEILEFFKGKDCYPNVYIAYKILLTIDVVTVASAKRKIFKTKTINKLFEIINVTRKIKWFGYV